MRKKRKEDEQTLEELNSARRRLQARCQLVQTSYTKRILIKRLVSKERKRHLTTARAQQIPKYDQIRTESRLFRTPSSRHLTFPSCC